VEVKDAQIKLVTIVPEGAALLAADDLQIQAADNEKDQSFVRLIWKEFELYCSGRTDLWLDRRSPSAQLPRILTKCSMEFDYFSSPEDLVLSGGAEAKGSLFIVAPSLLAHMSAYHFNILRAVFSKFFVVQASMSEQHKEQLAYIQYKLQLAPEAVGDVTALRNRVRNLALEIKDMQSKIRDLEMESFTGNLSPELRRKKAGKEQKGTKRKAAKHQFAKVCQHCEQAFVNELEIVEVDEAAVHARCVVDFRTTVQETVATGALLGKQPTRIAELRRRLLQKQKTFQASTELLNLLWEAKQKVRQGSKALPTWKLQVRLEHVHWQLSSMQKNKEELTFCHIMFDNMTSSILMREDESGIMRMEINRISISNHLPNTELKYQNALQPLRAAVWSERDVMIRVFAAMRSPVGGITVFDHFEFNITPLRVSITGELYQHLFDYIFEDARHTRDQNRRAVKAAEVSHTDEFRGAGTAEEQQEQQALAAQLATRHRYYTDFEIRSNGKVYFCYEETDYVRMRERAEANRMFIYWKLTDVALLLTFKKGLSFENLKLVLHAQEFRTRAWSWDELIAALKSLVIRDVLGQTGNFLKHAFTRRSQLALDTDDIAVRPRGKVQAKLELLGTKARDMVSVVTGGIVSASRPDEEEKDQVEQRLKDTLAASTTQDGVAEAMKSGGQLMTDEQILGNVQKHDVEVCLPSVCLCPSLCLAVCASARARHSPTPPRSGEQPTTPISRRGRSWRSRPNSCWATLQNASRSAIG
jgi:hypothetical protein